MEAISCLHQLPIASAQTLTLADISGEIALVECTPDCVEVTTSLSNTHSFVCDTNAFHLTKMMQYNSVGIDDWFAETRFQTMISAFQNTKKIDLVFVKKLLSGDYGFLCQYDRSTGKDTVWSVIYDSENSIRSIGVREIPDASTSKKIPVFVFDFSLL